MIKKLLSFFGKRADTATQKTITNEWFPMHYLTGATTTTGEIVTQANALTLSTVWACVSVISEDVGKLPFHCFQKTDDGKQRVDNNIDHLLNFRPNAYTSAMDFRQCLTAHVLTHGNAYAEIQKDIDNKPIALWILPPDRVRPKITDGTLLYEVKSNSGVYYLLPEELIHLKGLGFDGLQGYSVIQYAAQSLGSALAADKFAGSFYGNGATFGGWLEHPGNLSEGAAKLLRDSLEQRHQGASNAHRIGLLEEGMKFNAGTIPPEQAQFLQTRQFNISEVCRWFRIQPHKVGDLSRAHFTNIEEQELDYTTYTLGTWLRRWEQEVWFKLFSPEERETGFYAEHVIEGLLRGNIQARYGAYAIGRQWGWLSVNDIRQRENMNKVEGGDTYLVPLNMQDASAPPAPSAPQAKLLAKDIAERLGKAELRELDKQLARDDFDPDKFDEWASRFYAKHNAYVKQALSVVSPTVDPTAFTLQKTLEQAENKRGVFEAQQNTHIDLLQERINELFQS